MKKFFALLKVSLKSMLLTSTSMGRGKKKRSISGAGAMALMAFLALYISGVYSSMLLEVLSPLGMEVMVFIYMGIAALLGGLLYTTFAVKGVVFGGKDNDLLLSMPVSSTLLMSSRVAAIYLENLIFSFFMLVPAGVACAIFTQRGVGHDIAFWLRVLLAALALPLLDTALSVLCGALVAFFSTKLSRGKALGQNLITGLYLILVFWFSFNLNGMIAKLAADAAGVKESLGWAAPLIWMADGLLGRWDKFLLFVGLCVLAFLLVVVILGKNYRRAVTAFQAQGARSDYKLSAQKGGGQTAALLRKEAKRFFGTAGYLWNAGLGLMLLPVLGVAALVKQSDLRLLLDAMGGALPVLPICVGAIGFSLSTCIITAPSISLEGKYLWLLREAPVTEWKLLWVKTGFQLMLSLPCTLIACVCLTVALRLSAAEGLVLLVVTALFAVGQAAFGMLMGLAFPKLDATNDTVVVKQSMASLLAMFIPMAALAAAGLLYWLGGKASSELALALPMVFIGALAAACALLLRKKGPGMLRAL